MSSPYTDRFAGRAAVITGGASGLGKAVAARIVAEGGQVSLWDLDADGLKAAATEVGDPQNLSMWLDVNGQRKQDGSSKTMIFPISKLVSYISEFMTLEPGDLITTGTPPGVGMGQKPQPVYLKAGDEIRLGIEKLGEQRQIVVAWSKDGAQ